MSHTLHTSYRSTNLQALKDTELWDVVVLGSGAAALGIALDAASRGFRTALFEERDFNAGPSVLGKTLLEPSIEEILQPGCFAEVRKDFQERRLLEGNAPGATQRTLTLYPVYTRFLREALYALKTVWRFLGDNSSPKWMDATDILRALPGVKPQGLQGGVEIPALLVNPVRLSMALIQTAQAQGAVLLNKMRLKGAQRGAQGEVASLLFEDALTGEAYTVRTRMIFNAAEDKVDTVRSLFSPSAAPITHCVEEMRITVPHDLMDGERCAIFLDRTAGSNAVFCAVPHDTVTRIGVERAADDAESVQLLLSKAQQFMLFAPTEQQIRAKSLCRKTLYKPLGVAKAKKTGLHFEFRNVISVVGGDWMNYRRLAESALAEAVEEGLVYKRPCQTAFMSLRGEKEAARADRIVHAVLNGASCQEDLDAFVRYALEREFATDAEDIVRGRLGLFALDEGKAEALLRELSEHELLRK